MFWKTVRQEDKTVIWVLAHFLPRCLARFRMCWKPNVTVDVWCCRVGLSCRTPVQPLEIFIQVHVIRARLRGLIDATQQFCDCKLKTLKFVLQNLGNWSRCSANGTKQKCDLCFCTSSYCTETQVSETLRFRCLVWPQPDDVLRVGAV